MLDKLDTYLAKNFRKKFLILLLFATGLYAYQMFTRTRVGSDGMYQIATAVNFLDGDGFVTKTADELGEIKTTKLYSWPYFYRIAAVPFLLITNKNVDLTFLLLQITAFLFMLLSIVFFINTIEIKHRNSLIALLLFFSAIVFAPLKYMSGSDFFTLATALFAAGYLTKFILNDSHIKHGLAFCLLIALLPQMRYAYIPHTIAFILFFALLVFIYRKQIHSKTLFLLAIPIFSLYITVTNSYFTSQATKSERFEEVKEVETPSKTWVKPFYAPFFNSFFPDLILVSLLQKSPDLYKKIALYVLFLFATLSFLIFVFLAYNYLIEFNGINFFFSKLKLTETILWLFILSNLIFYIYYYRNDTYSIERINSSVFNYQSLSVVNRYFAPIHFAVYMLAIIYILKKKVIFFKYLIVFSVLFGSLHFAYLFSVYHPLNRNFNMNIVNTPEGSYFDMTQIGTLIRKEKASYETYFISEVENRDDNFRQVKPHAFAAAQGVIMLSSDANLELIKQGQSVLMSVQNDNSSELSNLWIPLYQGKVYDLYKYQANAE